MNYRRLHKLFEELTEKIIDQHTLYLDSIVGYESIHKTIIHKQNLVKEFLDGHEYGEEEFQDTCATTYKSLFGRDYTVMSLSPVMKQGDVKKRTKENGRNYLLLGSQCVVAMYAYWEGYLRKEIANAMNKKPEEIKNDVWGDIRFLRNAIVHNNGVATSDMKGCKILKWFKTGEKIELDYEKMRAIFMLLAAYRNHLHELSFPPSRGFIIPRR